MGIAPSKTELFLPSDTIRVCSPDRCWCNGRHHRSSKYVYVERGGDGGERYQDPVDMMGEFLMGGGTGAGMPWKNPGEWTVRDYERLGEVLNEWQMRERGRRRNPSAGIPAMMGGGNVYGSSPWDGGGGGGRRRRTHPSWGEFERMQETVEDKFRRMAEEYQRHISERDSLLFGSASDHRREQYRNNMLKTLQEILPQLSQMMAAQQMAAGNGMNMGMGMPGGMGGGGMAGMGGVTAGPPGMGMHGVGMQGMNMNPMMNPMVGAMGGGGGMGQMNTPMMPNDFGGGGGFGRRGRGRRERPFREDFEEEFGGFGGGGGRAGRPLRRGRRGGGWGDDDEDMLGGEATSPRRPQGGPRRPRRPDGGDFDDGGGGGGGVGGLGHAAFGHDDDEDIFRTAPPMAPPHTTTHFHPQPGLARQPGMGVSDPPERYIHHPVPPLRRMSPVPGGQSGYTPAWTAAARERPMDHPENRPASTLGARQWYTGGGSARPADDAAGPSIFPSSGGAVGEAGPSGIRPDAAVRREAAGFQPEARLSRPRDEETDRREAEAGAVPTKRDLQ